jgi:hypothetical protein
MSRTVSPPEKGSPALAGRGLKQFDDEKSTAPSRFKRATSRNYLDKLAFVKNEGGGNSCFSVYFYSNPKP